MFPGRTDNAIKNRWNSMLRKEDRRLKRVQDETLHVEEDTFNDAEGNKHRRRRLVHPCDLQPAPALHAVHDGTAPVAGSALMQQLKEVGVEPPQVKPGGRRKRAVQAREDMDAASLLLGTFSKSCKTESPPVTTALDRPANQIRSSVIALPYDASSCRSASEEQMECPIQQRSLDFDGSPHTCVASSVPSVTAAATAAINAATAAINAAVPWSLAKVVMGTSVLQDKNGKENAIESPRRLREMPPTLGHVLTPAANSPCRLKVGTKKCHSVDFHEGLEAARAIQALFEGVGNRAA